MSALVKLQVEVLLQRLPTLVVASVQLLARVQAPLRGGHAERGLEHEGLGAIGNALRNQWLIRRHFEAIAIWAMRRHDAVQRGSSWLEAVLLGLVFAEDQAHELAHAVSWNMVREDIN